MSTAFAFMQPGKRDWGTQRPMAMIRYEPMNKLCDGSRRPVRGARHRHKTAPSGHMKATCPVCKRRLTVKRVLGTVEFPRHKAGETT